MSFSADAPIETEVQDQLGRRHFSMAIARALRNLRADGSFVVGLFGGWGSGKTSVKNLAVRALTRRNKKPPLVIHFNPWLVSRQEQLVEAFYRDITATMLKPVPGESQERAEKRLSTLASYLSVLGTATEHSLDLLAICGVPGAALAARAAESVKKAGGALKESAEAQKQIAENAKKTLTEIKEELRRNLAEWKTPLLVVIDDVDRLTRAEICLMFQLIKANTDFPQFVYLVLCDRPFVTDALNDLAPGRGAEFLEKIVQIAFDLPQPQWPDLVRMARADWESISRSSKDAFKRSDIKRWNELVEIAKPYIRNVRSVRRWMNAVRFSFGFFRSNGGFDANPEDLLAIEILRVNEPALYERISVSKLELTYDQWDFASWLDDDGSKRKASKDALLASVEQVRRDAVSSILEWAFPNAQWSDSKRDDGMMLRDLRVGDRRCFDRYFQFVPGKETLSRNEVRKAIDACKDCAVITRLLRYEHARGRLPLLFDHLLAHVEEIRSYAATLTEALFSIGDELPDREWTAGGAGIQGYAVGFLISLLRSIPGQNERTSCLLESIPRANGLMLPFFMAAYESSARHRGNYQESELIVPHSLVSQLEQVAVQKIEQFRDSPLLTEAESFGMVLAMWMRWSGSPEKPGEWLTERLRQKNGLWQVLRSASRTETSGDERSYISISADWLSKLLPIELIDDAVRIVECEEHTTEEAQLLKLYRAARESSSG